MKINYNVTGSDRKQLVSIITHETGVKATYKGMPSMAYCIDGITIEKDGTMVWDENTDAATIQKIIDALAAAGFEGTGETPQPVEAPAPQEAEPVELTVSLPLTRHTGASLRNLINLVYTRASLLNKALGTSFRVEPGLTDALQDDACILTVESLLSAVAAYEDEHGKVLDGITITPEEISFTSLPETTEPERLRAFTELVAMMNKQAIEQKRVQAKAVNEENEKYALRIWLTRLGMNGPEFKTTRKVLMENLTGHSAFRTPAEEAKWKARQAEKREALKAAKEAAADENPET
jgi:Sugar diacid utilization regulator